MALCMSGLCHKGALLCHYQTLKTAFRTQTKAPESLKLVSVTFVNVVLPEKRVIFCDSCGQKSLIIQRH